MNKEAVMMNGGDDHDQDQELLQAQAYVWNHILSFTNSMSLKCAVELGIPDVIHNLNLHGGGKPATISELIDALKIDKAKAPFVSRLMRVLTHSGFFVRAKKINVDGNDEKEEEEEEEEEEEGYLLTSASKLLLNENPLSMSPFLAVLDPIMTEPWQRLSDWYRSHHDTSPFVTSHGKEFWEMAGHEPRFNNFFNEAMASDARLVSSLIIGNNNKNKVFEGLSSLVDVGGGTGNMGKAIAKAFPEMKCTIMDLPHVVQGLKGTKNLTYVGGDMFQSIPPAHAILLKSVLHNWSDEESVKILKKCKEAIPNKEKGGKVMIVDMVLGEDNHEVTKTKLSSDMFMMVLVTGRERQEKEWKKLFLRAGFSDYKITPVLGLRSLIELYYY